MSIEIRPPEAGRAAPRDAGRGDRVRQRQRRGRGLGAREQVAPGIPCARCLRRGQAGRSRRRIRVRPDDSGRRAAVRRSDMGRRAADAPPAGHPPRSDATAARRHSPVGRADRGALGLGGGDLRPLRLWAGGSECPGEVGLGAVRAAAGCGGRGPAGRCRRGTPALLAGLRERACHARRHALARRALVEGATARGLGEQAPRREHEVLRRGRGRRSHRGLRDVSGQGRVGGRVRDRPRARARSLRRLAGRRGGAVALSAPDRPHRARRDAPLRSRVAATAPRSRSARARCCGWATGCGCGSSTSTRR